MKGSQLYPNEIPDGTEIAGDSFKAMIPHII